MTLLLVIESLPNAPDSLTTQLGKEGFSVISAASYIQVIEALRSHELQAILFTHNPPYCNGLKYLKEYCETRNRMGLPKLVVSELSDRSCFREAMNLGADDFIPQPYSIAEIVESLHQLIQRSSYFLKQDDGDHLSSNPWTEPVTQEELKQFFARLQQDVVSPEATSTLYLFGIDQLNWFRSTLGSGISNSVMKILATRLVEFYRAQGQIFCLAKIDDHQFAILPHPGHEASVQAAVTPEWQQSVSQAIEIQGQEIFMTTSVAGIEFQVADDCDFEMVMSQARKLLRHSQAQGGNQFSTDWYCESTQSSHQFSIATNLLRGLTENEFHAYYQPQLDLATGKFVGVEALVRWHHREWGTLDPGQFIPVAEETGSIIQIDERVLRLACRAAQKWKNQGYAPLNIAVNLSACSFNRPNLSDLVCSILQEYNVSPEWLELEITESMLVQDMEKAAKIMNELKSIGVSIALDDFGVGYSSLSYLQQFPLDTLKIDQSFIQKVDTNRGNAAITEAVIQLAQSLNLKVVAEGVERVEEREFLKRHHCDAIQGFLISHPVPESVFDSFLSAQTSVAQVA